jgi:hypothetical protein
MADVFEATFANQASATITYESRTRTSVTI